MLDFYVKIRIRFSLLDKRLFEITEVEITRDDCNFVYLNSLKDQQYVSPTERTPSKISESAKGKRKDTNLNLVTTLESSQSQARSNAPLFSSPGRSPGRAFVLPPASALLSAMALASALAKC